MQLDAAAEIVRGLSLGVDVCSGGNLPAAQLSPTHKKALAVAAALLEREVGVAARQKDFPRNHTNPWSEDELNLVKVLHAEGKAPHEIAERLERTTGSVKLRMEKLGLVIRVAA